MSYSQHIDPDSVIALFSALSDVYFFVKDTEGYFLGANDLQLEKLGLESEAELNGKSDYDFFPSYMVEHYARDDQRVIESGTPILQRVELVANADGSMSWHVTSKFPLHNRDGNCIGIIGVMRDFERSNDTWQPFRRMNAVIDYINQHYQEPIQIPDLAQVASLSLSQFERRFIQVFDQTPARFLIRYRLTRASALLIQSEETISWISQDVGFYDHSHFSREFKKLFGLSPGQYRQQHTSNNPGTASALNEKANH